MGIQGGWTTAAGRGVCWWCLLLALVLTAVPARAWQGRVRSVPDGDSLTVERAGRTVKVRLYGIDSPEYRQPGWLEAPEPAVVPLVAALGVSSRTFSSGRGGGTSLTA